MQYRLPPRVLDALIPFLAQQRNVRPVLLSAIVRATRYADPNIPYSDDVLAVLLAKEIVRHGCAIEFDGSDTMVYRTKRAPDHLSAAGGGLDSDDDRDETILSECIGRRITGAIL